MPDNLLIDTTAENNTESDVENNQEANEDTPDNENTEAGEDEVEGKDSDTDESQDEDEGAPEAYEAFKLPDGVEADEETVEKFKEIAKELNLSQDKAQRLVDLQTSLATKAAAQMQEHFNTVLEGWKKKATSDKEYGGKAIEANLSIAKKAMDKFATDDFKKAIQETGFGNHPELIRLLYRVGKAMSEDGILNGGTGDSPRDPARILFPDMN